MACHEGNEALAGALAGERNLERERAKGMPTKTSSKQ
jgi:hypothetical protein